MKRNLPIIGRRRNPKRRPAHVVAMIPGRTTEIRYIREGEHSGPYKHGFAKATNVRQYAMSDGSVLLKGNKRIHADDTRRGFEKYARGESNPMHKGKESDFFWWLALGGLLYFVMMQRSQGITSIPAGVTGSPLPSGGSSNTSPDILTGAYNAPTPNAGASFADPSQFWAPPMLLPPDYTGMPVGWL